jgi:hypothetical protein
MKNYGNFFLPAEGFEMIKECLKPLPGGIPVLPLEPRHQSPARGGKRQASGQGGRPRENHFFQAWQAL